MRVTSHCRLRPLARSMRRPVFDALMPAVLMRMRGAPASRKRRRGPLRDGGIPALGPRGTSLRYWAQRLVAEAQDPERVAELSFWSGMLSAPAVSLVESALDRGRDISASAGRLTLSLPASVTHALLTRTGAVFHA